MVLAWNFVNSSEGGVYSSVYALCRKTSEELTQLAAKSDNVKIVENIEVTKAVREAFQTADAASLTPIHLLIHNAGAYGPPEDFAGSTADGYASHTLQKITVERMRFAFELNTLAPLMLTQALVPNLEAAAGIVNTLQTI